MLTAIDSVLCLLIFSGISTVDAQAPPTISVLQQLYQVDEGKPVTIYISVSSATNVSWTRNGSSITPGQNGYKIFTADSPDLIIYNAAIFHAGIYVLTASNTAGSNKSLPITLSVTAVPVVIVSPKPVIGNVGQSVTIYCIITRVTSNSSITITWYHDNIAISRGNTYTWSNTAAPDLNISNFNACQHPGTYRCNATNSAGTGYDETTLSVIKASTGDNTSLSQAAIAAIVLGVLFVIQLVTMIIIIIYCYTHGACHKDDTKSKVGPSEKKTDVLHEQKFDEQKKASELSAGALPERQTAPDSFIMHSDKHEEDSTRVPARKPPHHLEPISYYREERQKPQHKTPKPRQDIPIFVEKSSVEDRPYRSAASAVSRKHVVLAEKEPNYGFEEETRYTDLPYQKPTNDVGPIISLLSDEQAFQIPESGSTVMCNYQEPVTSKSSPPVKDTTYLHEDENMRKKNRNKKKKRHHHHHHHGSTEQFGDEEPYPEGSPENPK